MLDKLNVNTEPSTTALNFEQNLFLCRQNIGESERRCKTSYLELSHECDANATSLKQSINATTDQLLQCRSELNNCTKHLDQSLRTKNGDLLQCQNRQKDILQQLESCIKISDQCRIKQNDGSLKLNQMDSALSTCRASYIKQAVDCSNNLTQLNNCTKHLDQSLRTKNGDLLQCQNRQKDILQQLESCIKISDQCRIKQNDGSLKLNQMDSALSTCRLSYVKQAVDCSTNLTKFNDLLTSCTQRSDELSVKMPEIQSKLSVCETELKKASLGSIVTSDDASLMKADLLKCQTNLLLESALRKQTDTKLTSCEFLQTRDHYEKDGISSLQEQFDNCQITLNRITERVTNCESNYSELSQECTTNATRFETIIQGKIDETLEPSELRNIKDELQHCRFQNRIFQQLNISVDTTAIQECHCNNKSDSEQHIIETSCKDTEISFGLFLTLFFETSSLVAMALIIIVLGCYTYQLKRSFVLIRRQLKDCRKQLKQMKQKATLTKTPEFVVPFYQNVADTNPFKFFDQVYQSIRKPAREDSSMELKPVRKAPDIPSTFKQCSSEATATSNRVIESPQLTNESTVI